MAERRTEGGDAITNLLLVTFRLNGAFLDAADAISAPSGLTGARWQVLGTLMWRDMTVSEIAREMGLSRQAVQRIANILADDGMLAFRDNPDDQRAKLASATAAGRDAISSLAARQHAWANAVAAGFDAAELAGVVMTLRAVADRLVTVRPTLVEKASGPA